MIYFLTLLSCSSALRFNEVDPGSITLSEETLSVGGRRRRRKGNGNYYDSPNVEYIIQYPGTRVTDAVKVAAYKAKLAADIATVCLPELLLTAGVSENKANVDKHLKDNLKITPWAISSSLLEMDAGTFTDLVTWPENPGWKTITPVAPSVFDSLFKKSTFTAALQVKVRAEAADLAYTQYGITGAATITERTVSTSTLTGTFRIDLTVSNPAGGPDATTPVGSFASSYIPTAGTAVFQGNSQVFMYEAKEALAAAFGVNKDYVNIERSDHLTQMCSTQIMFNFPTTQVTENDVTVANLVATAAIADRKLHQIFATAAATVLNVDANKIEITTFVSKTTLGNGDWGGGAGAGDTSRFFDVQLMYETACTAIDETNANKQPWWYDEEARRVATEIGVIDAKHIVLVNKIWTEAKKSSPFEITFAPAAGTAFDVAVAAGAVKGVNPKYITLDNGVLAAPKNLRWGVVRDDGHGLGEDDKVYQWGFPAKGRKHIANPDAKDMNVDWNKRPNNVGSMPGNSVAEDEAAWLVNAQYRVKYTIAIKNAVDHNAATLIKSYVAMADASAEHSDAFSVKLKDSLAGATNLLGLGCTVTKAAMKSEATTTLY